MWGFPCNHRSDFVYFPLIGHKKMNFGLLFFVSISFWNEMLSLN